MEAQPVNNHFLFWQKWLFISSIIFAIAGLVFALCGALGIPSPYDTLLAGIFWHAKTFPPAAEPFRGFIYGPLGGTITCCYTLLAFIAYYPFREKKRWARNAIIVAFTMWVIIDSLACIYFGVYPQIYIINLFSITVKALPIIFTWKDFKRGV